jgi:hypothetical protein
VRFLRQINVIWTGVLLVIVLASLALPGARFFLLPSFSAPPMVVAASPPDGARDVSPRTSITIQFTAPMNPPAVERALRIEPATEVVYSWDTNRMTLTVTPTTALQAGTRYRVTLTEAALSQHFRPLAQPFTLAFETVPPAAVIALWPRDGSINVPLDTLVSVRFSRPIALAHALARSESLSALHSDPPLSGSVTWLDPVTLLFRPAEPLRPGVRYTFSLDPDLTDQGGVPLGRTYTWSFTTLAPAVREVSPPPNARQVGPYEPLRIVFSQPIDLQALEDALSITPAVSGSLEDALLPDGAQVVTYTPAVAWQAGTAYTVALPAALADGTLFLAQPYRWSFIAAPKPALIGRFPGEGQLLLPGGNVRLIFSTPIDAEALRTQMRIEPPVDNLRVITNDGEARIDAQLQAATLYTITIPSSLSDRAGVSLERDYQLRFFTAPAAPSLTLPEANGRVIRALPDQTIALLTRRTNLSELRLALYRLDEATLLRALSFNDAEWTNFEPSRYGLSLLRSWSEPLADPLNATVEARVTVALDDGSPLPPGIYFLRVRTPERVGTGSILVVSRASLALQVTGQRAIVWATDTVGAAVLPNAPLALYRQGSLIAAGRSDERGVWTTDLTGINPRDLIAVSGDLLAFATLDVPPQSAPAPRLRVVFATDRSVYSPGEEISIRGFVRQPGAQSFDPPTPGRTLTLEVRDPSGRSIRRQVPLDGTGAFETTLSLPSDALPGIYHISTPQDERNTITFRVEASAPPLQVTVTSTVQGQNPSLLAAVRTPEGLPVAGAEVFWTIDYEIPRPPADDDVVFGKPDLPPPLSGANVTDNNGMVAIVVPSDSWYRYRFRASIAEPHGPAVTVERLIEAPPAPLVGLRAPSSIVRAGTAASVEVVTLLGDQTLAAQRVQVEATLLNGAPPDNAAASPADRPILSRVVITDSNGRTTFTVPLLAPGTYRVRASLAGIAPATPPTDIILRAYQPKFTDWIVLQGSATLLADRAQYRPGDTALILPLESLPEAPALLTVQHASGDVREELRVVRAGEPVTLTLTADDAPGVRVTLTPATRLIAQRRLQVDLPVAMPTPPLSLTLTTDAQMYAPGATAALTLTVTDANGDPAPADVLVRVTDADERQKTIMWRVDRTDDDGVLLIDVPLPQTAGVFLVDVWVAGNQGFGEVRSQLMAGQAIVPQIITPPFVRAGDQIDASIRLTATDGITRETRVMLRLPDGTSTVQVTTLPGEGVTSIPFALRAPPTATLELEATVAAGAAFSETVRTTLPVLPPAPTVISAGGALVTDRFETQIVMPDDSLATWGWLDVVVAPSLKTLARERLRVFGRSPDRQALEDAAIILMATSLPEAQPDTQAAITHLTNIQKPDGGWAWQSGGRSNPAVVAIVLEALAGAQEAGVALPDESLEHATTLATRLARDPDVPLESRVCLSYALARLGVAESSLVREWDDGELDVHGLACRLLMLPPDQARVSPALPRLISLVQRTNAIAWWRTPPGSAFPYDDTATTALAVQAIHHASPRHPLATDAARWLIARMTPVGWGDALTTARVVQALRVIVPADTAATIALTFNGAPVTLPDTPDATLRLVPIPIADLRSTNTLVVTSSDAPALVAWQVTHAASAPRSTAGAGLLREYLDPHTGTQIDPTGLRPGRLVQVRLTFVAFHERRFVTVRDALPAGFALVDAGASSTFDQINVFNDRVELTAATLMPGIHQHTYLVRASVPGSYAAPSPELILPGDRALAGVTTASTVRIEVP